MPDSHDRLLSLREAAERMGYSAVYLRRVLEQGSTDGLPPFHKDPRNGYWKVPAREVDEWIDRNRRSAERPASEPGAD